MLLSNLWCSYTLTSRLISITVNYKVKVWHWGQIRYCWNTVFNHKGGGASLVWLRSKLWCTMSHVCILIKIWRYYLCVSSSFFFPFTMVPAGNCQRIIFRVQRCPTMKLTFCVCVCMCEGSHTCTGLTGETRMFWFSGKSHCWGHVTHVEKNHMWSFIWYGSNKELIWRRKWKPEAQKWSISDIQIYRVHDSKHFPNVCRITFRIQTEDCQNKARHQNRFHRADRGLCRLWFVLQWLRSSEFSLLAARWGCDSNRDNGWEIRAENIQLCILWRYWWHCRRTCSVAVVRHRFTLYKGQ